MWLFSWVVRDLIQEFTLMGNLNSEVDLVRDVTLYGSRGDFKWIIIFNL